MTDHNLNTSQHQGSQIKMAASLLNKIMVRTTILVTTKILPERQTAGAASKVSCCLWTASSSLRLAI